jgi:hypothetical protein
VPLSVSCPTARFCVAVDDQGNALRFVNGVWSKPQSLQASALTGVSCTAPDFCVAVGVNDDAYVLRGAAWSPAPPIGHEGAGGADSSGTSGLSAVSCVGTTFCMAGDVAGRVWTFDGRRWTRPRRIEPRGAYLTDRQAGTAGISGLSCATPTFCVAVTVGGRALIFDGKSWSTPSALEPAQSVSSDRYLSHSALAGVSCPGPGFCVAVDPTGNVVTLRGGSWSAPRPIDPLSAGAGDGDGLNAVSCVAVEHCVAVDGRGDALTDDNGVWSQVASVDATLGLTSISCGATDSCVALNDLGQAATSDGRSWSAPHAIEP